MGRWFVFNKRTFFLYSGLGILMFGTAVLSHSKWSWYISWFILASLSVLDVLKKNIGRVISYGAGFLLSYVLLVAYLFGRPVVSDYANRTPFDSVAWKRAEESINDPIRIWMVTDLLKRYSLQGMSRKQIDDLLGVPHPTSYFREYDYVYWLGPERGVISIDSEWLGIKFENDVVTEARILRD